MNTNAVGSKGARRPFRLGDYIELTRPFTLLAPLIGFFMGGLAAWGYHRLHEEGGLVVGPFLSFDVLGKILIGAISAASLNAASNIINQIYDLEIDKINKPKRPLCDGRITIPQSVVFMFLLYALSIGLAAVVGWEFLVIVLFTAFVTYAYSGPPFRTKRWGIAANITIAIPRGTLLIVAGWTSVATFMEWEPWAIGLIFFLYVVGAATTKDFSDMEGDEKYGCITLPIKYGVRKSAYMVTPFFVIPYVLMLIFAWIDVLNGNQLVLTISAVILALWGVYTAWLILRDPDQLTLEANHVSWTHMYLMLMFTQIAFGLAYVVPPMA